MLRTVVLGALSLLLSLILFLSAIDTPEKISPQGCRMSYMSPSYILQADFNSSWSPLARRYSLWLYREVGWDSMDSKLNGVPALFIPGNAGSSRQVRSIASSATRQYYASPASIAPQFSSRNVKPLDFFAVEFNEDLSAFHGPTLESQSVYTSRAIDYILSLYPPNTTIIIMGHSMGGIVATSLLPSPHISSIITMSTPHSVPPARFDSRIDSIYTAAQNRVAHDDTPILSICGGITDTMIPSEFCALPVSDTDVFRKTIYTTALEGCWSGVGHKEMVWCHQVRWRVARAGLELGKAESNADKAHVLQDWFRDGITSPSLSDKFLPLDLQDIAYDLLPEGLPLLLRKPVGSHTYVLPTPHFDGEYDTTFILYLSQGSIYGTSPADPISLKASAHICRQLVSQSHSLPLCEPLEFKSLKLIPNPVAGPQFPLPNEGVTESEGVVALTAVVPKLTPGDDTWIAVKVEGGDHQGWVVAGLAPKQVLRNNAGLLAPLLGSVSISTNPAALYTEIEYPHFLSNVLLVYRVTPEFLGSCKEPLLSPLLLHISNPSEAHYHILHNDRPILLHSHSSAPFLHTWSGASGTRGLNLTVYSSGECGISELKIKVDWWSSFGRWGPRYWNAILTWGAGVVGLLLSSSWTTYDSLAPMPTVTHSLNNYTRNALPQLLLVFFVTSFVPIPATLWLGNKGEPVLAPIAPLVLLLASGLVYVTWWILLGLMWPIRKLSSMSSRAKEDTAIGRRGLVTILFISTLVFLLIPWQVAFLGCYLIHFYTCAAAVRPATADRQDAHNHKMHVLLLMTWCLPVVAPVLAVWVRTLATAGPTTPFDGDHFVVNVIGFMIFVYYAMSPRGNMLSKRHKLEFMPVAYWYAVGALVTFILGPRSMYQMYESMNWPTIAMVVFRVVPQLWSRNLGS